MTGTHRLLARTPRRVCFAGDWHGNATFAAGRVMSAAAHGAEVLVQVGDFGFWHGPGGGAYVQALEKVASRSRLPILWIDGNHEAHTLLSDLEQVEGLGKVSEHIWHLPRGLRWQWGGAALGSTQRSDECGQGPAGADARLVAARGDHPSRGSEVDRGRAS